MHNDARSHGLWEASSPPAEAFAELSGMVDTDVAIVGGGYTGLSAALHLAEFGSRPVVLEAVDVGFGGSGRNVGLVNAGLWLRPSQVRATLGEPHGSRLIENLGAAPALVFDLIERHGIACEAQRHGTLHCAVRSRGLREIQARHRQWAELGAEVELLDRNATSARTGSRAFAGALLDRRAGTLQPLAYVRGLAEAAGRKGARIFRGSPVIEVKDLGDGWELVSKRGTVRAQRVLVATNAYSWGPWASLRQELVGLPYFNLATRPLSGGQLQRILPQRQGLWDSRSVLSSARLDAAGRLVFGSVGALAGSALSVHRAWARRALARLYRELSDVDFEYEWYGCIGMTLDAVPRLHRLARHTYSISGYNGRGIGPGTYFGRELAYFVAGKLREDELSLRFSALQPAPLRRLREFGYEFGSTAAHFFGARF